MTLGTYRKKRDFTRTSEPRGRASARARKRAAAPLSFVVQKHDARSLHYDFRLELDGVLLSWAIPKGPSLDPGVKRLAMQTEDHPLEYGSFEGVIPEGQYGAGPVEVWDRGIWIPEGDPKQSYDAGRLTFRLEGKKLGGGWHLVRTAGRGGKKGEAAKPSWLLIKRNDSAAQRGSGSAIVDEAPESVKSGRTIEQINEKPRRFTLTHPDRVLYPEQGITKADLALYYAQVAGRMLPHLVDRPLMLVRCPEGTGKQCFHQKHPTDATSDAIRRVRIVEKRATREHMTIDDGEGLLALVQLGALEIHTWGSRAKRLEYPDQLTFDLDPDEGLPWQRVTEAAHALHDRLEALGLPSFVKTTGGKGLHVVVPIAPRTRWDVAHAFCQALAEQWVREEPERYVSTVSKAKRRGKILIDYLRNGRGATAVCAYSTRARAGAPVSTPLVWSELDTIDPKALTIRTLPGRIAAQKEDPWRGFFDSPPALTAARLRTKAAARSPARGSRAA
ncbi:MAG TPA: non-homologous end-joining DNA ligase [Polyangiales bacterium]|nr:non-homologous end-joining DNA ligase [Polyangiales bacterium]